MRRQVFLPNIQENPYFIYPEGVGHYKDDPMHGLIRNKSELSQFNLHIIISGKGYLEIDGTTHTLQGGDGFLYYPGEAQHYYSDVEQPWEIMWLHFNGHYIKDYLTDRGYHLSKVWTLKLNQSIIESILKLLEETESYGILHPSKLSSLSYEILSEFITQSEALTVHKGDIYSRIMDLLPLMREHCAKPFVLEAWADKLSISIYYFCRMFKKTTGHSPNEFVTLCRLQKSKQLLMNEKNLSIKQIALECGYMNISYFGKIFLKNEGVTPLEYRKRSF